MFSFFSPDRTPWQLGYNQHQLIRVSEAQNINYVNINKPTCTNQNEKCNMGTALVCFFLFSPLASDHCYLLFGWRAGHAWSPLPSWPQCLEIDNCSRSVARCTWDACQKRSLSPQPASASLSCVGASSHWLKVSLIHTRSDRTGQSVF